MKTLFKQPFQMLVATIVTTVALGACSNEMNPADVSTGEPQTVAVRFTTSSAGQAAAENPWQEGDQVTVAPQGEPDGAITFGYTKQADESYVWQNIVEGGDNYLMAALPANFTAYFPTTPGASSNAFALPIIDGKADQSDPTKLRAADYMTAPPTTVSQVGKALDLTLAHRLCRLTFVVTEYGKEFGDAKPTLEEVKIKSQNRTVNLTYEGDKVEVVAEGTTVGVSPLTTTNASDQPTYTAIVTPCDLTSGTTELMSLTVNGNSLRVKYKGDLAALASGNAYTFQLKVGTDYVTVTASGAKEWTGKITDVISKDIKQGFAASDLKVGDYYYSDGKWSDGGYREYTDGTTTTLPIMPVLTDAGNQPRTAIGIVYWLGDATAKDKTLKKYHPECTHGLVVALSGDVKSSWQPKTSFVQEWLDNNRLDEFLPVYTGNGADAPLHNIQGYNNTKAIEAFNAANSGNIVTAVQKAVEYRTAVPAPDKSSDWYLPSAKELTLLCGRDVDNIWRNVSGIENRDFINGKLQLISGTSMLSSSYYKSSSEGGTGSDDVVDFSIGKVNSNRKTIPGSVRFSLAF